MSDISEPPRDLDGIQRLLAEAFRRPEPLDDDDPLAPTLEALLSADHPRLSPLRQAEIYREQFWRRHVGAVREDLPALGYLLGDEAFGALLQAYFGAHPPTSWTLRDAPSRLPAFAERYEGFPAGKEALCRELIRWEVAFIDAFDRADEPPIDAEAVDGLGPEDWVRARLSFRRTLTLMVADHPVHELRQAVRAGEEPSRHLASRRAWLALWRNPETLQLQHRELPQAEHALLEALRGGEAIGAACERIAEAHSDVELGEAIGGWFRGWSRRGWITAVRVPST